jgi:DNA-binding MarR family transcriptional regulator
MSTEPITQDRMNQASETSSSDPNADRARQEKLRALIHRVELAGCHQRAARSRQLRAQQIEVLAVEHIATSGSLSPGQLADRLGLTSGGVAAVAQRLEDAGLIVRRRHPHDRRMRVLVATPEGLAYVREYLRPLLEPAELALSWLSEPDRAVVGRFLELLASLKEKSAAEMPAPEQEERPDEFIPTLLM